MLCAGHGEELHFGLDFTVQIISHIFSRVGVARTTKLELTQTLTTNITHTLNLSLLPTTAASSVMIMGSNGDKPIVVMIDDEPLTKAESKAESESESNSNATVAENIRKTTVALTGGAIVGAGLILIPFPIIPGIPFVYGGMMLLATEFEPARDMLEKMKEPIAKWLDDNVNIVDDDLAHDKHGRTKSMKHWLRKALSLDSDDALLNHHPLNQESIIAV